MSEEMTELQSLKERAEMMGLKVHPRAGVDKIKAAINAKLNGESTEESTDGETPKVTKKQKRELTRKELVKSMGKLVRITLSCNDPQYAGRGGVLKEVGNSFVSFKKFIPFDTEFHVPSVIVDHLRGCTFTKSVAGKDKLTGRKTVKYVTAKQFVIDTLAPLTEDELKELASQQARSGSIED